jgi:hypothetical protein
MRMLRLRNSMTVDIRIAAADALGNARHVHRSLALVLD